MNPAPKPFYLSKTFWLNAVALLSMAVPQVRGYLASNPVEPVMVLSALNVILRFLTKGKISFASNDDGKGGSGTGLGSLVPLLFLLLCGLFACVLLPSCQVAASAITGEPVPSTAVARAGQPNAPVVMIASGDLAAAEAEGLRAKINNDPPTVHGLYDAGQAASALREVFIEPTK